VDKTSCTDICIIGAGIVGLSTAYQILQRYSYLSITIIDKEENVGKHSSGRNSGVLHAGLYYQPESLKAKVCVRGGRRLKAWCHNENISVMECGKVITPQKPELDKQLEILVERGLANGATVELIDEKQFKELVPDGHTSTGRAVWSPDTCIVKPIQVVKRLKQKLQAQGVNFVFSQQQWKAKVAERQVIFGNGKKLSYDHLINCSGLQADRIAHQFNVGREYTMLPFKGSYWQLKNNTPFKFNTNLYPVPDLEVPFLGAHVTPSIDGVTYLGPTATPALGRENYKGLKGLDPLMAIDFFRHMATQVIMNEKMRNYVYNQAFDWTPANFLNSIQAIVPKIKMTHIEKSQKVGIRPQLYDKKNRNLVQDFVMLDGYASTHVVNAISPAFTASFELADYILDKSKYFK
jgi:(S)-2-hydroxyglutarate dehydrogenase